MSVEHVVTYLNNILKVTQGYKPKLLSVNSSIEDIVTTARDLDDLKYIETLFIRSNEDIRFFRNYSYLSEPLLVTALDKIFISDKSDELKDRIKKNLGALADVEYKIENIGSVTLGDSDFSLESLQSELEESGVVASLSSSLDDDSNSYGASDDDSDETDNDEPDFYVTDEGFEPEDSDEDEEKDVVYDEYGNVVDTDNEVGYSNSNQSFVVDEYSSLDEDLDEEDEEEEVEGWDSVLAEEEDEFEPEESDDELDDPDFEETDEPDPYDTDPYELPDDEEEESEPEEDDFEPEEDDFEPEDEDFEPEEDFDSESDEFEPDEDEFEPEELDEDDFEPEDSDEDEFNPDEDEFEPEESDEDEFETEESEEDEFDVDEFEEEFDDLDPEDLDSEDETSQSFPTKSDRNEGNLGFNSESEFGFGEKGINSNRGDKQTPSPSGVTATDHKLAESIVKMSSFLEGAARKTPNTAKGLANLGKRVIKGMQVEEED